MSQKTLIIGIPTKSKKVKYVQHTEEAPSLFDFDIVIADIDSVLPTFCQKDCPVNEYMKVDSSHYYRLEKLIDRLRKEVSFLLEKGGTLVCIMKPKRGLSYDYYSRTERRDKTGYKSNYDWIPIENLDYQVEYGEGREIKTCNGLNKFNGYLQMHETFWTAYFENIDTLGIENKIVGLNDANKPVAIEFHIGKGVINFQPCSTHPDAGDILLTCTIAFSRKTEEKQPPSWISAVTVPNEVNDLTKLAKLGREISELQNTFDTLNEKTQKETRIKKLLYEKDEALENVVKESFEELGFSCKKKDDKDWMISAETGEGILEVTGSESTINIKKFRQLLNYLLDETKESGDEKKAILVANHFSDTPIDTRGAPFSKKAIDESKIHSMCLMPTSELFNLVCNFRLGKIAARDAQKRILETTGVFSAQT